jgi:CRISPR/Cas system-associated protein Csm6
MSTSPMFGIGELRDRRGAERVTFSDLADVLVAFAERSPQNASAVDELASYLAAIGSIDDAGTAQAPPRG